MPKVIRTSEAGHAARFNLDDVTEQAAACVARARAEADVLRTRSEMYAVARQALAGRPDAPALPDEPTPDQQQAAITAALALASAERPAPDGIVDYARATLEETTAFVRAKNFVSMPEEPLEIIVMPVFQRGVALAYCDSPGPLDKGQRTFYAVSPLPADWTEAQVDSFLREYSRSRTRTATRRCCARCWGRDLSSRAGPSMPSESCASRVSAATTR